MIEFKDATYICDNEDTPFIHNSFKFTTNLSNS